MIMKTILKYFIKGLAAVLPAALTVYLVWALGSWAEHLLGALVKIWMPEESYVPGTGLLIGLAIVLGVGILTEEWLFQKLFTLFDSLFDKVPFVKTIHSMLKDLTGFFRSDEKTDMQSVVSVEIAGAKLIGFVTRQSAEAILGPDGASQVAVYLPMSYQLGGFMIMVPRDAVTPLELSVEEGLRLALTAGVQKESTDVAAPATDPEEETGADSDR